MYSYLTLSNIAFKILVEIWPTLTQWQLTTLWEIFKWDYWWTTLPHIFLIQLHISLYIGELNLWIIQNLSAKKVWVGSYEKSYNTLNEKILFCVDKRYIKFYFLHCYLPSHLDTEITSNRTSFWCLRICGTEYLATSFYYIESFPNLNTTYIFCKLEIWKRRLQKATVLILKSVAKRISKHIKTNTTKCQTTNQWKNIGLSTMK